MRASKAFRRRNISFSRWEQKSRNRTAALDASCNQGVIRTPYFTLNDFSLDACTVFGLRSRSTSVGRPSHTSRSHTLHVREIGLSFLLSVTLSKAEKHFGSYERIR